MKTKSFNNFLKTLDVTLHKHYILEKFKEGFTGKNFVVDEPKFVPVLQEILVAETQGELINTLFTNCGTV
jgi:Ca2+-binding EF-hand superfamily protein